MKKNAVMRTSSGALAGVFASFFTHPMDVVRARLTVQDQSRTVYSGNHVLTASFTKHFERRDSSAKYRAYLTVQPCICMFVQITS